MKQLSMKKFLGFVSLALALTLVATASVVLYKTGSSAGAEAVEVVENATVVASPFTEAVQKVKDSVVGVNNYTVYKRNSYSNPFGFGFGFGFDFDYGYGNSEPDEEEDSGREVLQGSGSGVVVAKGYVLTNFHVVENAKTLEITSGENTYAAAVAASDELRDLAVLKVDGLDIAPVVLGDSDKLNVGDWAICIGNPLSFNGTTTVGIISALNRQISQSSTDAYGLRTKSMNTMIQTDAAINAGNSGGGMFNAAGELVGIPSMKYTGSAFSGSSVEGIGMAIPINEAKELIQKGINNKDVVVEGKANSGSGEGLVAGVTPRIGVTVGDLNTNNPAVSNGLVPIGAYIKEIEEGSPAEQAGLKVSDIVVEVDGNIVNGSKQMVSALKSKNVGDTAVLKVYRVKGSLESIEDYNEIPEGEYIDITVELAILDDNQQ